MKVICERCHKQQDNRTAQVSGSEEFALGCIRCGCLYGRYPKRKEKT